MTTPGVWEHVRARDIVVNSDRDTTQAGEVFLNTGAIEAVRPLVDSRDLETLMQISMAAPNSITTVVLRK